MAIPEPIRRDLTKVRFSGEGFFAYDAATDAFSPETFFHGGFGTLKRLLTYNTQGAVDAGHIAVKMNPKLALFHISLTVGELIMTTFEAKATLDSTQARGRAATGAGEILSNYSFRIVR